MIAVALVQEIRENKSSYELDQQSILNRLDIPDSVKANLMNNLEPYFQAIEVSGYEKNKVRKMMLVGNTGKNLENLNCNIAFEYISKLIIINDKAHILFSRIWEDQFLCLIASAQGEIDRLPRRFEWNEVYGTLDNQLT